VNKGIYCQKHNVAFAPLVDVLARQMRLFNAHLAVRHDREKHAKPFECTDVNNAKVVAFDGIVQRIDDQDSDDPIQLRGTIGGPKALRAIGYVALTFLAHCRPESSRLPWVDKFKRFLTDESDNDFVWWAEPNVIQNLPANPYQFGHTIALQERSGTGEISAIVSLFGSLHFAVQFGAGVVENDITTTIFVDPLAENPPHDLQVQEVKKTLYQLIKPDPIQEHLLQMVQNGNTKQFQDLMNRIERWSFDRTTNDDLLQLNALYGQTANLIDYGTKEVVERNFLRVYRLMKYVVDQAGQRPQVQAHEQASLLLLHETIAREPSDKNLLTSHASECLQRSSVAVAKEIATRLARAKLSQNDMFEVFSSGTGAAVVGRAMMDAIMEKLRNTMQP
jgi:hypothetical protein